MKIRMLLRPIFVFTGFGTFLHSSAVWAQTASGTASGFGVPKESVFWATFLIVTSILVFCFLFIAIALLRSGDWKLGDALAEEAGNQPDPLPAGMKPIMVASSSRLIALLGLLSILGVFLGFGYYFLYSAFAGTVSRDDMRSVIYYLFSGAVMFAPYLANQLRDAFTSFGSARQTAATAPAQPAQAAPMPSAVAITRGVGVG